MKKILHIYTTNYLLSFPHSCLMLKVSSLLRVRKRQKFVCSKLVMVDFLRSHLCSAIAPDLCILGPLSPLWYRNALGGVTQMWWDPKALQRHFVLPSLPAKELWFDMYTLHFSLLLLCFLPCQLRTGKKPFSKKRKLLEYAERWSRSGLVPLRGALFSEQSYLCLPGGFKLFFLSAVCWWCLERLPRTENGES